MNYTPPTNPATGPRSEILLRLATLGGAAGLLAGLAEAAVLSITPTPAVLLAVNVRNVVWFLAPLTGICCLGLLGLALGLVACGLQRGVPSAVVYLNAIGGGLGAVYLGAVLRLIHARGQGLPGALLMRETWIWFLAGFVCSFVILRSGWHWTERLLGGVGAKPVAVLARAIWIASALALLGIVYYQVSRLGPGITTSRAMSPRMPHTPNIVLITLDTVRADHLSSYGYYRPTTPNLDRLALQGVLFENAIAPSSWTLTSHASMFTELLPHQHGANRGVPLDPSSWTLAKILQSRGYETAGFSANFCYGLAGWGMRNGFEIYDDDGSSLRSNLKATIVGRDLLQPAYQHLYRFDDFERRDARAINRDVFRWFERRSDRPFFLFINYYDAHSPYLAPPPYDGRFGRASAQLQRRMPHLSDVPFSGPLPPEDHAALVASYDNCLAFLDEQVGHLMQLLAASPEWPHTIVIITSDHGEEFSEHGSYGHCWNLYREVLHVPLIIFGPGIPEALRISPIAQIRQLYATVLDLALGGIEPIRRASLRRFWSPGFNPEPFDQLVISELDAANTESRSIAISLMTPEWHYLHDWRDHSALYHWPSDPKEKVNLEQAPEHQAILQDLQGRLEMQVGDSLRPWRGPEYLFALNRPGYSFLREIAFGKASRRPTSSTKRRIGASQAYFAPDPPTSPLRLQPIEEELLRTLPYH